ncbi:MAG: Sec-independent protein translocase protein TatB [Acidimicrobiales bacterium]
MFNIGGGELIVIMLLALIVLGPKRLPEAARQVGKVMADLRRLSSGFQNEVRTALDSVEDTDRVTARRNVLAREQPPGEAEAPSPRVNTDPLAVAPGVEPVNETSSGAPKAPLPSAHARAAARKQAAANPARRTI